jgi:hypothetical protein
VDCGGVACSVCFAERILPALPCPHSPTLTPRGEISVFSCLQRGNGLQTLKQQRQDLNLTPQFDVLSLYFPPLSSESAFRSQITLVAGKSHVLREGICVAVRIHSFSKQAWDTWCWDSSREPGSQAPAWSELLYGPLPEGCDTVNRMNQL